SGSSPDRKRAQSSQDPLIPTLISGKRLLTEGCEDKMHPVGGFGCVGCSVPGMGTPARTPRWGFLSADRLRPRSIAATVEACSIGLLAQRPARRRAGAAGRCLRAN